MNERDDIDGLAAEYVLGSLDAAERRQVEARRETDAALAAALADWERRLGPLNSQGQGVAPPEHVLDGILARISEQAALPSAEVVPMRRAFTRRWAALAAAASALAACLALVVVWSVTHESTRQQHSKLDCGKLYKDFWQARDAQSHARTSPEQLAGISRMALRAYDSCQAGDEQDAKALLARLLGRSGENASPAEDRRAETRNTQCLAGRICPHRL
jgi:anti-sigma factor RsiW